MIKFLTNSGNGLLVALVQSDSEVSLVNFDEAIAECVKRILHKYGGSSSYLFLYSPKTKKMLKSNELSTRPEELEDCLDHMFDGTSVIIRRAIIDEVTERFGLGHSCETLKEAFERAHESRQRLIENASRQAPPAA